MSTHDILRELHELGARLQRRDGELKLRAGKRAVPATLVEQVRAAKSELVALLENSPTSPRDDEHLRTKTPLKPREILASAEDAQMSVFDERLRTPKNPKFAAPSAENPLEPAEILASSANRECGAKGAYRRNEYLRVAPRRALPELTDTPREPAEILASDEEAHDEYLRQDGDFRAPKVLIEGAQMSSFDETQHSCGLEAPEAPKVLIISGSVGDAAPSISQPTVTRSPSANAGRVPATWLDGLSRLRPKPPPRDVPLRIWQQFITDARRLVDTGILARAVECGWTARDLFGCDRDKPFARIDQMGLVWLINGGRILGISRSAAAIRTAAGAQLTYRRKVENDGQVLVWELCSGAEKASRTCRQTSGFDRRRNDPERARQNRRAGG